MIQPLSSFIVLSLNVGLAARGPMLFPCTDPLLSVAGFVLWCRVRQAFALLVTHVPGLPPPIFLSS